jgi:ABC-2 type transport system ATP-binding protein
MSDPVIAARGLTKRYRNSVVVDGVNFEVGKGEIFGLLGPNGAGKTTTILMMLGLTEVSSGEVRVLGHDPVRSPLEVKRRVGYLPDSVGFYDQITAVENLAYTARLMGIPANERQPRILAALERVRLHEVANQRVATFSRGMRQRLGLAEILLKRAEIAILDEPTSGLDPQATHEFLDMIEGLKREGVTVLLSSHMLDQVQRVCDRVALFQGGRIVLIGKVSELAQQVLGGGYLVDLDVTTPPGADLEGKLRAISGVTAVTRFGQFRYRLSATRDVRADAATIAVNAGGELTHLGFEEASLDAIYTRYFQRHPSATGGTRDAA